MCAAFVCHNALARAVALAVGSLCVLQVGGLGRSVCFVVFIMFVVLKA